jgi:NADPH-dependent glutamate synthase beta subunit-like oxidoreductase
VIGGGIEGLSAAFFSARLGHATTVYEATSKLGGLLRSAIARYRLPMDILDWDIEGLTDMGVHIETDKALGKDVSVVDLLAEGNNAVLLAVGGWDSRLARTGGKGETSPVPGCHLLIDIMKAGSQGYPQVQLSGHVLVVGNPNLATAMIQRCKDLGAEKVSVLMRQAAPADLDGADIVVNKGISRLYGQENRLTAVDLADIDNDGLDTVATDHIVFAAGRMPEMIFIPAPGDSDEEEGQDTAAGKWQAFPPYKQPAYHAEIGLMANGDVMTDYSAAIKAIAAGRRAAASVHKAMYDIPLDLPDNIVTPDTPIQNVHQVSLVQVRPRQIMPMADPSQVARGSESELGFDAARAQNESNRCLQCGLICYLRESEAQEIQTAAANS